MQAHEPLEIERIPHGVVFKEDNPFKDTYAGAEDLVFCELMQIVPKDRSAGPDPKQVIVFSHPIGGGAYLPMVTALARAGHHCVYANTRFRGNDTALIMEKCVVDFGAGIRYCKERLGYDRVILGGWSGGGSLSLFYQSEAEQPRLTHTPAGEPLDLTAADLIPADGILLLAAHISRAGTLTEWMDASILDESKPFERDPKLNLYDPGNPNQPPYDAEFLERYRNRQIERNRRITSWVQQRLHDLEDAPNGQREHCFTTHGTMADPRWLDPAVDPNQRRPGWCYLGDPRVVNDGPVGLARFSTLRSWMSQWSYDHSNGDGVDCAARTSVPTLVIGNLADDACTPSHTHRLYDAIPHERKKLVEIDGATHYYFNQPAQLAEAVAACGDWLGCLP